MFLHVLLFCLLVLVCRLLVNRDTHILASASASSLVSGCGGNLVAGCSATSDRSLRNQIETALNGDRCREKHMSILHMYSDPHSVSSLLPPVSIVHFEIVWALVNKSVILGSTLYPHEEMG